MPESLKDDPHILPQSTTPEQAQSDGLTHSVADSGIRPSVRKASEAAIEQDIPVRSAKRIRAESDDEISVGEQRSFPRRLASPPPSHLPTDSSRSSVNETLFNNPAAVTTAGTIMTTAADHSVRSSSFQDQSSTSRSSVSTLIAPTSISALGTHQSKLLALPTEGDRPVVQHSEDHTRNFSADTQQRSMVPNTPQSDMNWVLLARFGIPRGKDLNQLSSGEATALLDQIYTHLQTYAHGSDEYPETLRALQDCCFYTSTLPTPFMIQNITYSKTDRIGRGGDALIYEGKLLGHPSSVVVRELIVASNRPKHAVKREHIQLLYREAITHSQLQHPNILPFLGIYRESNESYPLMVLPYLEQGSLEDMLREPESGGIDSPLLIKIVVGTARGIAYLHSRKPPIIHGDLHPGNILIDEFNNPVLCDFGRSRIRHEFSRNLSTREQGGRIRFLAPEILDAQEEKFHSSQESDVFGLAMTYFNAWSGYPPFHEIKIEHRVASNLIKGGRPREPAQPVVVLDQTVNSGFWALLVEMWSHEPVERPSSHDVLNKLERVFDKLKHYFPSVYLHLPSLHAFSHPEALSTPNSSQNPVVVMDLHEREKMRDWLAPADPDVNQEERIKQGSKVPNHAQWLFDHDSFQEWLSKPVGFFWVSASAGVGKSVLCSQVVEYFQKRSSPLAFFYFDYRDPEKEVFKKFLATCVEKLGNSSPDCREILRLSDKPRPHASEKDLLDLFHRMLGTPGRKFLIIDAVDECRKSERLDSLLPFIQDLMQKLSQNNWDFRIFATSRPEPDIEQLFDPSNGKSTRLISHRLRLGDQPEHRATVSALIDAELNSPRFRGLGWSNDDFYLVKEELLCKSESMILWVHLQLQELDQCTGHEAREMLLTLPNSLDQTYARILSKISPRRRRAVRAVLECIIVAPGLLTPTEIGEILLFQFNHINDYPQLLPLAHTVHSGNMGDLDIFKLLPGLLKTNKVLDRAGMISPGLSVEFIHFTVKEYLLSSQTDLFLPQMHDAIGVRSMLAAFGTSLAKASVTFALVLLSALDEQNSSALPSLSEFASGGWLTYTKAALPQYSYIAPALGHFLHPDSRSFRSWAAGYFLGQYDSSNTNEDHPLHWAVRLGSRDEVKRILAAHPVHKGLDIRNAYDRRMWTPICYAACMGNLDILSDLLKANPLWAAQRVGQNYQSTVHLVISQSLITSRQRVGVVHIDRTHWKLPNLQIFQRLCDSAGPTDRFAPDMSGNSAITDAIRLKSSNKFGIIKLFLEKGADSNTKNGEGLSLAHLAARDDECTSIIHALVQEHGVDVETLDNWGRTPLLYAFPDDDDFNHPQMLKCVRSLLNEGADPNAHDYHGLSVLDYALKSVFHGLDKYIRSSLYYDNEPGHRLTFYMPYTEELDILKRIYDLIEGRGGCHATLETPHTPEGRWSWLKLWQGGRYQNSGYKDRLTSEKFKQYLERIDWR